MKKGRSNRIAVILLAVLVILITTYYINVIIGKNSVSRLYDAELSLTGSRLSDSYYAKMKYNGSWATDLGSATQLSFDIYNTGESNLENWTITMDVPLEANLDDYWGCEAKINNAEGTLTITPEYYNNTIAAGGNITFGFIIDCYEQYTPTSTFLSGYNMVTFVNDLVNIILIVLFTAWIVAVIVFLVSKFNVRNYRQKQKNDVKIILQSMNTFINFIDAKDPYTRGHSKRVAMYAAEIAKRMRLSDDEIQNVYYAGLLHDSGKISVPDAVLNKPGKLTDEEMKMIQNHTVAGGKMLLQLSSLRGVRETALYHHERYDGTGYPDGLKGDMIPLYARIVGVADSYDAMSSNRVYRRHLSKDEIIEEIQKGAGTQFDPSIVQYMIDMINDGYVNVVKMETAENEDGTSEFHITEDDVPGVYMGF